MCQFVAAALELDAQLNRNCNPESKMTSVSGVGQRWPILRTATGIILIFTFATPMVRVVSNLLVEELIGR